MVNPNRPWGTEIPEDAEHFVTLREQREQFDREEAEERGLDYEEQGGLASAYAHPDRDKVDVRYPPGSLLPRRLVEGRWKAVGDAIVCLGPAPYFDTVSEETGNTRYLLQRLDGDPIQAARDRLREQYEAAEDADAEADP
jgi:hypothetical protein